MPAKFEVSSFTHSGDMEGVPKFQRSRDPLRLRWCNFALITLVPLAVYMRAKFEVSACPAGKDYRPTCDLALFSSYGWLLVKFSLVRGKCLILTLSLGWSRTIIAINDISLKTRLFGLHFRGRIYWYLQPLLRNPPRKLPNSVKLCRGYGYYAVQGHPGSSSWYSSYAISY